MELGLWTLRGREKAVWVTQVCPPPHLITHACASKDSFPRGGGWQRHAAEEEAGATEAKGWPAVATFGNGEKGYPLGTGEGKGYYSSILA